MLQPTLDARHMDEKSQKIYLLNLKIQDSSRNLAKPDLGNVVKMHETFSCT